MRNTMLAAVAAFALIGGSAFAQTDDSGTSTTPAQDNGTAATSQTDATTVAPAADATTTNTVTTQPTMAGGTIGQSVTDSTGTVVGVVSDVQMDDMNALSGIIIKDSTGSFVAPPSKLKRNPDGTLMLAATPEEIANWPTFGGDSVGEAKGGAEQSGQDASGQGSTTN